MKNRTAVVFTAFLVFLTSITISAQRKHFKQDRFPEKLEKLNLNDTQKEKVNTLQFNLEERKIDLKSAIKKNRLEVKKLMVKESFSDGELMELVEKGADLRTELVKLRISFWLDVNKILDPEQKVIWKKHFRGMEMLNDRISRGGKREFFNGERRFRNFDKRPDRL